MCSPMLVISLPLWKCCGEDCPTLGRSRAAQRLSGEPRFDDDEVKAWAVALLWPLGVALALTAVGVALSCLAFCAHQTAAVCNRKLSDRGLDQASPA